MVDVKKIMPNMILNEDLFDHRGNLLLEKGLKLTASYIERLKNLGFEDIKIVGYDTTKDIKLLISPKIYQELYTSFQNIYVQQTSKIQHSNMNSFYYNHINTTIDQLIDECITNFPNILNLNFHKPSFDEITHSINVCLLSIVTGLYLKLPKYNLKILALGALFHDIGRTLIKNDNERNHPLLGRKLLENSPYNMDVLRIVAEHHERYDGSGFPYNLKSNGIHPLSRIVIIANDYDLSMTKAFNKKILPTEIVEYMMANGNKLYDLNFLRAFFQITSIYPVGSIVTLSTNQQGYVVKNNAHYPLRPVIRLHSSDDAISTLDVNLAVKPNLTIKSIVKFSF